MITFTDIRTISESTKIIPGLVKGATVVDSRNNKYEVLEIGQMKDWNSFRGLNVPIDIKKEIRTMDADTVFVLCRNINRPKDISIKPYVVDGVVLLNL